MEENQVFGKFNKGIFIFWKDIKLCLDTYKSQVFKRICNICELMLCR